MKDLRKELVQAAAVIVSILEDLDEGEADTYKESTDPGWWPQSRTLRVFNDIQEERHSQDEKWGPQHHEMPSWFAILMEEIGEAVDEYKGNTDHWGWLLGWMSHLGREAKLKLNE